MKKVIKSVIAATVLGIAVLLASPSIRQAFASTTVAIFDTINRAYFVAVGTQNMSLGTTGSGEFSLLAAGTPVAKVDSQGIAFQSGFAPKLVPNTSPIFVSTPVTGTNFVAPGLSIVPPTATANTAAFVGAATPVAGTTFKVYNSSTASVYLKAAGGATINGAQAGGRFLLATLCTVDCVYSSATNLVCTPPVCATPLAP